MVRFEVVFLEQAKQYLSSIDPKSRDKILFNIWKARHTQDPTLFKKLTSEIWEFRTRYRSSQYRLLAFWDKDKRSNTLVIVSHGFVKKVRRSLSGKFVESRHL